VTDPTSPTVSPPRVDRPRIPASYGVNRASTFVEWSHIEHRLARDRVYWLAAVGTDGRPRVRPIDALYLDGVIYVGGSGETRWVHDVEANPAVSIHLDGVDDVVLIEGDAEVLSSMDPGFSERLAAASNAKFPEYKMTAAFYRRNGAIAIRLRKVIAWTDITADPTRFRFDGT
jgi:nitroimidazol reductase NimA-like FMN-containing flavoprotein (pyridoxamine 5'-phosphate oxidase superfamily)